MFSSWFRPAAPAQGSAIAAPEDQHHSLVFRPQGGELKRLLGAAQDDLAAKQRLVGVLPHCHSPARLPCCSRHPPPQGGAARRQHRSARLLLRRWAMYATTCGCTDGPWRRRGAGPALRCC